MFKSMESKDLANFPGGAGWRGGGDGGCASCDLSLILLRFCCQHQQFALVHSELIHIAQVISECRHHCTGQSVCAFRSAAAGFDQEFVVFDSLSHHLEALRYQPPIMLWVGIHDSVVTGGKEKPSPPMRVNVSLEPIR